MEGLMPIAVVGCVLAVCVSGLVGWAWWLAHVERVTSRALIDAQAKRAAEDVTLRAALGKLDDWERRLAKVEIGRAFK